MSVLLHYSNAQLCFCTYDVFYIMFSFVYPTVIPPDKVTKNMLFTARTCWLVQDYM